MSDTNQLWAKVVGVVLLLVGLIGFVNNPILGLFSVNSWHNVVHLLTGALFAYVGWQAARYARNYNKYLGLTYLLVAVLGFLGVLGFLNVSGGAGDLDNWLHLVIGIVTAGLGYKG